MYIREGIINVEYKKKSDRQTDGQTDEKTDENTEKDYKWPRKINKEMFCKKETERKRRERE
jgi:hypothetical protein